MSEHPTRWTLTIDRAVGYVLEEHDQGDYVEWSAFEEMAERARAAESQVKCLEDEKEAALSIKLREAGLVRSSLEGRRVVDQAEQLRKAERERDEALGKVGRLQQRLIDVDALPTFEECADAKHSQSPDAVAAIRSVVVDGERPDLLKARIVELESKELENQRTIEDLGHQADELRSERDEALARRDELIELRAEALAQRNLAWERVESLERRLKQCSTERADEWMRAERAETKLAKVQEAFEFIRVNASQLDVVNEATAMIEDLGAEEDEQ